MTDPIYGDNPIDSEALWNDTFRPPLVLDPEWLIWRAVIAQMLDDLLESQWLVRWRRALATAEGAQLTVRGAELGFPQPAGWTDDRYRDTLLALFPVVLGVKTPDAVYSLATAMLDVGQTVTFTEEYPASTRIIILNTSADEAIAYASLLDRARTNGHQYILVAHPGGGASPFTIGTSQIGGPDTIAKLVVLGP